MQATNSWLVGMFIVAMLMLHAIFVSVLIALGASPAG